MIVCTFAERVKELIFDKKISPEILSRDIGVSISIVYTWQQGEYTPNLDTLFKLSDYFEVTIEYLSGRKDENYYTKTVNPIPFKNRLQEIIKKTGLSNCAFGKRYNIHRATIQHWVNGERVPLLDSLIKLADLLDVTIDYLAGLE